MAMQAPYASFDPKDLKDPKGFPKPLGSQGKPPTILWLGEHDCHRPEFVGGKAANLSRLAANYRVPPAFCLTASAFSERVIPYDDIVSAYQTLAAECQAQDPSVAVRSSAIDEDGDAASFAGQYESFLNVVGVEAIIQAVSECWGAANSERIRSYRQQQGLSDLLPLAVLVQQQIGSDVSAVAFSANPVSGDTEQIVINASWGLGESIVSGTVTPDTYIVQKPSLKLTSSSIADKRRMTVYSEDGTREVNVPRVLSTQPALNEEQILEIARLSLKLEQETGWPVDVECAYQTDELFLLQCRPITALQGD
jgi:pyruvate,water dikinase